MRELVVISGKGGTGKTSLAASFAVLADRPVIADCDVDAADLHLVLSPEIRERHEFRSGHEAVIRQDDCIGCGACLAHCRFGAVLLKTAEESFLPSRDIQTDCEQCDYCKRSCSARTNAVIREMAEAPEPAEPLVTGGDLMRLGLRPGPAFREILEAVEEAWSEGEVETREEALDLVRARWV